MEAEEVVDIYKISVENYNILYNPFTDDGDSTCILFQYLYSVLCTTMLAKIYETNFSVSVK